MYKLYIIYIYSWSHRPKLQKISAINLHRCPLRPFLHHAQQLTANTMPFPGILLHKGVIALPNCFKFYDTMQC